MRLQFTSSSYINTSLRAENGVDLYVTQTGSIQFFSPNPTTISRVTASTVTTLETIATLRTKAFSPRLVLLPHRGEITVDEFFPREAWPSASRIFRTPNGDWKWTTKNGRVELYDGKILLAYMGTISRGWFKAPQYYLEIQDSVVNYLDDIIIGFIILYQELSARRHSSSQNSQNAMRSTMATSGRIAGM